MEIRQRQLGNIVCLDVGGRIVLEVADGLKDRVNSLFFEGHRDILLNLRDVSQVDTTGLAALTAIRAAAERHGGMIKIVNLPPRLRDLLVLTRLITLFDVYEAEEDALKLHRHDADAEAPECHRR